MELEKIKQVLDTQIRRSTDLNNLGRLADESITGQSTFAQLVLARCEIEKLRIGSNVNVRIENKEPHEN